MLFALLSPLADVVIQNPGSQFGNTNWLIAASLLAAAYLIGSIPSAVWISKRFFGQDIRTLGSKNAGSTNMYRVFGLKAGLPTQLIDIAKGSLAVALPFFFTQQLDLTVFVEYIGHGHRITNEPALPFFVLQLACGLMAIIGHVYTIFAGFKGGKGVNTMLGMMLVIAPLGSAVAVGTFVLLLLTFRMVSLGSMLAVIAFTGFEAYMYLIGGGGLVHLFLLGVGVLLSVFIVYTHRTNIGRIFNGTESKVPIYGKKK